MKPEKTRQNRDSGGDILQGKGGPYRFSDHLVPYPEALADMEAQVASLAMGSGREQLWFLEHPPLYTSGTSARAEDLLNPGAFEVFEAGRGGEYTYHGPGQRVVYVMLDLGQRKKDLRAFVASLEGWIIAALAEFGVEAGVREGRIGVWVVKPTARRPRSPRLAFGSESGSVFMESVSMWPQTSSTSRASFPAVSATSA